MFERFTERARQVIVFAQDVAKEEKQSFIGTQHVLIGLIREEEGLAARVLASMDVTHEAVMEKIRERDKQGTGSPAEPIPYSPRAKTALELSLREALSLGHNYIGTEHILLGIVRGVDCSGALILRDLGADGEKVRNEVIRMLSGPGGMKVQQVIAKGGDRLPTELHLWNVTAKAGGREQTKQVATLTGDAEDAMRTARCAMPNGTLIVGVEQDGTVIVGTEGRQAV